MTQKTKKSRKFGRAGIRGFLPAALVVLISSLIAAVMVFRMAGSKEERPLFEEVYSRAPESCMDLMRVDKALYESLYKEGIEESRVFFTEVSHRHTSGGEWDFTEIQIRLPEGKPIEEFHETLALELDSLQPEVEWFREPGPDRDGAEAIYHVYIGGRYTHRVRLLKEPPGRPPERLPACRHKAPRVAIIIDDLGYDRGVARGFLELDFPLSISVLPLAPRTRVILEEARRQRVDVMLHLPMEPKGYPEMDPGPGALLQCMSESEIRSVVTGHLARVAEAEGVNNHMGSRLTESRDKMTAVMEVLRERGLFFVDSKTSPKSVAFAVARDMGVPAAKRNVFLDNEPTHEYITIQMEHLLNTARHRGRAVGIAHPFPETLGFLRENMSRLDGDFDFIKASEIVRDFSP
jgi:hypothetical protein